MRLRTRQLIASSSAFNLRASCSGKIKFPKIDKNGVFDSRSPVRSALGRWRLERWRSTGLVQPCRCSPQLFFRLGSWNLPLQARASLGCTFSSALQALLRPVVHYTLALSAALSGGFSTGGTLLTSALILALSIGPMISLLSSGR